jgi:hypothetical protein
MFDPEDFDIPLEKELKMRLVYDDIEKCTDVSQLQTNLKVCAESLMRYQHLLAITIHKQLEKEIAKMLPELG